MSRTLNRPMFRRGGKVDSRGTGITTGLMPRKNYAQGDLVTGPGGMSEGDTINYMNQQNPNINTTLGVNSDYDSISELMGDKQKLRDEFGLNYEIPEPEKGLSMSDYVNIFGTGADILLSQNPDTVGEKVKETAGGIASNIDKRKIKEQQDIEKAFGVKSGDFESAYTTLSDEKKAQFEKEANIELQLLKNEQGSGSVTALSIKGIKEQTLKLFDLKDEETEILNKYPPINGVQQKVTKKEDLDRLQEISREKIIATKILEELQPDSGVIRSFLNSTAGIGYFDGVADRLKKKFPKKYIKDGVVDEGLLGRDAYALGIEQLKGSRAAFEKTFEEGGRVEKQNGGSIQTNQPETNQLEETYSLTYEELRSRLPQEITDDIVLLLSSSNQALSDFAGIQTQEDIGKFNRVYGVNLVISQGA